ncbi:MAG: hypothetical protein PQJ59_04440 [Spirochaetales bacterium]|nr:hypothetical protein [Spirochaetales bacterium]
MILGGIDEAGLGPVLGPYCAGLTLFSSSGENLYALLADGVSSTPEAGKIAVGDSKKLYTPAKGIRELEKSVLAFYGLLHGKADNFADFLNNLSHDPWNEIPWFKGAAELKLPLLAPEEEIQQGTTRIQEVMEANDIRLKHIGLRFIIAAEFNRGLDRYSNKSTLCQELIGPFMEEALKEDDLILTVDRQGGRRFYGDWLLSLLPGKPLQALEELAKVSTYRSGNRTIKFLVGADGFALETALASLFAKYARECAMVLFNRYWQEKAPELKKTAGYYKDGMRFVKDLETLGLLRENRDILIRKK